MFKWLLVVGNPELQLWLKEGKYHSGEGQQCAHSASILFKFQIYSSVATQTLKASRNK